MNILPANAALIKPQSYVQNAAQRVPTIRSPEIHPTPGRKEEFAKAFYTREDEPWLNIFYSYTDHTASEVKTEMRRTTKQEYIESTYGWSALEAEIQSCHFQKFRNELLDLRPDLAGASFSYTLGDDAELKIIDVNKKLGEHELKYLSDVINQKAEFKESARKQAKLIMTLVDHDTDTFNGQYKLDLTNFQDVIDLGTIAACKKNDPRDIWINQVRQHAEKKEMSLVDIRI
ncbi:hypothetical protein ACKUFS_15945 [Pseudomonas cannabina]|uniref:Uncharacterized protein n=1 Tax=Pseudomonas cannabina TaxID=86840 RepID=A0A3M3R8A9_PSECA|nr:MULTISPECIES: hypothetical protein [Pseudomonas syringae group]KPW22075.1 hypothetical protein ALO83_103604 [Pseudomonas cannabina pv. alisalensis]RMN79469.1 hypothetical protein ALQ53_103370 [Pseudomonas cannabina]RMN84204.1 hypothetical protein ALQ52_104252 [Pseudomonas cannabina pv. alisalensis]RMN92702.1 hypothetical protein ALQ51_00764 [Pseudomonas cannabina]UBY99373.1 hypothetical protein LCG56_09855 [Pseudomonas cannabina pv. alisalensis]